MIFIAHRGNTDGPNPELENRPDYVRLAQSLGFHVEVDVWHVDGKFFLGHDRPDHEVAAEFLENNTMWCHAKTVEALDAMIKNRFIHCFFHQNDDVTLTSRLGIWTFPGKKVLKNAICVMPEIGGMPDECFAICTDYPIKYKTLLAK
jgi:hypothetical protein